MTVLAPFNTPASATQGVPISPSPSFTSIPNKYLTRTTSGRVWWGSLSVGAAHQSPESHDCRDSKQQATPPHSGSREVNAGAQLASHLHAQ